MLTDTEVRSDIFQYLEFIKSIDKISEPDWYTIASTIIIGLIAVITPLFYQLYRDKKEYKKELSLFLSKYNDSVIHLSALLEDSFCSIESVVFPSYLDEVETLRNLNEGTFSKKFSFNSFPEIHQDDVISIISKLPDTFDGRDKVLQVLLRLRNRILDYNRLSSFRNEQISNFLSLHGKIDLRNSEEIEDVKHGLSGINNSTEKMIVAGEFILCSCLYLSELTSSLSKSLKHKFSINKHCNYKIWLIDKNIEHYKLREKLGDIVDSLPEHSSRLRYDQYYK